MPIRLSIEERQQREAQKQAVALQKEIAAAKKLEQSKKTAYAKASAKVKKDNTAYEKRQHKLAEQYAMMMEKSETNLSKRRKTSSLLGSALRDTPTADAISLARDREKLKGDIAERDNAEKEYALAKKRREQLTRKSASKKK